LLKKLREGLQARMSFSPKVKERIDDYKPNPLNTVTSNLDGEDVLKGSFNPEYVMGKQTITDNYFRDKSLNGEIEHDYAPVIVSSIYEKKDAAPK
jgi:hypothetical protein